jgi:predicted SAM-dependent methyltransferase
MQNPGERNNMAVIEAYLAAHEIRKLHIGCGSNRLEGWLNSDYFPKAEGVLHLDATARFPIGDAELDYIFSEHMIEHVSYAEGISMLCECHRVLRPNGIIRISTPDLQFLMDLYRDDKSELQKEYIKWATEKFIKDAPYCDDVFVINNFFRDWGHLFIYDEKTLRRSLETSGFVNIIRCGLNESSDDVLKNLENDKRMPEGFLALESFTLEASKKPVA